jgi:hypothetical protein
MNKKLHNLILGSAAVVLIFTLQVSVRAQTWMELTPTGSPPIQTSLAANYDAANNRLIVYYAGNPAVNSSWSNQVWVLTNANGLGGAPAWVQLTPTGTPPNINIWATANYDSSTNSLIVYGGGYAFTAPALDGVFVLSNANGLGGPPAWSQLAVTNPQMRINHSAVYNSQSDQLITFGGSFAFFGSDTNDTRSLSNANGTVSPSTWSSLAVVGGPPGVREGHAAVYDQANDRMTLFGGSDAQSCCYFFNDYNDTWVLSNGTGVSGTPTWTQLNPAGAPPTPRSMQSGVYDQLNNRLLVFGGLHWDNATQAYTKLGDLWQLSNANGTGGLPAWMQLTPTGTPLGPRYSTGAAFDSVNQRMIILGGIDINDQLSNRVWVLVFNNAPVASCQNVTVVAGASSTVAVSIDNGSFDPDTGDTITLTQTPPGPYPIGETDVTLTVEDNHGAFSSCQATVTVLYDFHGFFAPVDNPPVTNLVNAGSAVPLKFSLNGNHGLNIFAGYPVSQQIGCNSGLPVSTLDEVVAAGNSSLSYNSSTDQYTFVWKTDRSWKGTCRQLILKLNDGSMHVANFQFK